MTITIELIFGLIACAIGIAVAIAEFRKKRAHDAWFARAARAQGLVYRFNEVETYNHITDFSQHGHALIHIVKYRAANKIEYEIQANSPVELGETVEVAYNPDLPSDAKLVQEARFKWGCGFVIIAVGIGMIVLGYT
jgi:hypothetical protein